MMVRSREKVPENTSQLLRERLAAIGAEDTKGEAADYERRYSLILQAMALAHWLDFKTGYRIDPKEPEWPVAFIELPTGQVSWHMPAFPDPWDGHSMEDKLARIFIYCKMKEKEHA